MGRDDGIEVVPVTGMPEVRAGDDLPGMLARAIEASGIALRDGDTVAVTQKAVSKAEGRVVPTGAEGKKAWVSREAVRIVARRGDLVIAETRHGLVCANAGVDESNVQGGFVSLLPEDPDASAWAIREAFLRRARADVAVVVTDTFGRPWRRGVVEVSIGAAGLPALVDLRGSTDATGRPLATTVVALADEIASAAGLVMGKAERVPAAVVRGARARAAESPVVPASAVVRPVDEDLFRMSPLEAVRSLRLPAAFGPRPVPETVMQEVLSTVAAGIDGSPRWAVAAARGSEQTASLRRAISVAPGETAFGRGDVLPAPTLLLVCIDDRPATRSKGRQATGVSLVGAGQALHALRLSLHALGYPSAWAELAPGSAARARAALRLPDALAPVVAVGTGAPAEPGSTRATEATGPSPPPARP